MKENKIKKLSVLLDHWVKHNDDHVKEYKKWAEIADKEGLSQVGKNLKDAAELILQSSEKFHAAKRGMPVILVQEDHEHHHHEHNHHKHDHTEE